MVRRRRALALALLLAAWLATTAVADLYYFGWTYPAGKRYPPEVVTVTVMGGTVLEKGLDTTGGYVWLATPGGKECYTIRIDAPGFVWIKRAAAECPRYPFVLPLVVAPDAQ